jgi:hypothetical protein
MLIPLSRALKFLPPLSLLFCVAQSSTSAQVFGSENVITTNADDATCVYAADLDGDGDADLLSTSYYDYVIAWYENLGGGTFGPRQILDDNASGAIYVRAADLDGDGDTDVVSASSWDDKVSWYENLGGGAFGARQVITSGEEYVQAVHVADLDSDGDMDVLAASYFNHTITWHENFGGGNFLSSHVITTVADYATSVYAADIDGDGDEDVLSASLSPSKIAWYENLGGGVFGNQQMISNQASGANCVYATDLDGDGDVDVLSASRYDDKIAWYENLGGGDFGLYGTNQQVITTDADYARSVYAADLDGDGMMDVLSASYNDHTIAWYQNQGNGSFGPLQEISTGAIGAYSVYATDLNGDSYPDVLSASRHDDKIAWHRNEMWWMSDCDGNQVSDQVDIGTGYALDCNGNGSIDACEISANPSLDADGNGILDSCEAAGPYWFRSPFSQRLMTVLPPSLYGSARADATVLGGTLATIRSAEENDWLHGILPGDHFWIGYNDATVEGTFIWHSQETPGYENWAPGAPGNSTADQDYVAFRPSDGTWDTWYGNTQWRAVVESNSADCNGDLVPDGIQIQSNPSLDMDGDGQLDSCVSPSYCQGALNSSGEGGSIYAIGSPVLSQNNLTLRAIDLPPLQWSYFIMSESQASIPTFGGSQGTLCLGAPIVRFKMGGTGQVAQTTAGGTRTFLLDFQGLPQSVTFLPGDTWNFQLWFRDVNQFWPSNTTDGVTVMFR